MFETAAIPTAAQVTGSVMSIPFAFKLFTQFLYFFLELIDPKDESLIDNSIAVLVEAKRIHPHLWARVQDIIRGIEGRVIRPRA
jgi:hypothetical protein